MEHININVCIWEDMEAFRTISELDNLKIYVRKIELVFQGTDNKGLDKAMKKTNQFKCPEKYMN